MVVVVLRGYWDYLEGGLVVGGWVGGGSSVERCGGGVERVGWWC